MNERQKQLLRMAESGKIELEAAVRVFGVAEMTIRRDFRALEARGLLMQVKGGAIKYPVNCEPSNGTFEITEIKMRLAEALYTQIMPFETVFIGTGSTPLAFAKVLARRNTMLPVTVVTTSIPVASSLFRSQCKVVLLGGELRHSSLDLVGPIPEKNLDEYHVDWLVTGCDGASPDSGFYTTDVNLSNLEKKTIHIATKVACVTESRKFENKKLIRFASCREVNLLVTDNMLPEAARIALANAGITIFSVQ